MIFIVDFQPVKILLKGNLYLILILVETSKLTEIPPLLAPTGGQNGSFGASWGSWDAILARVRVVQEVYSKT
jgi:hypothetical protein